MSSPSDETAAKRKRDQSPSPVAAPARQVKRTKSAIKKKDKPENDGSETASTPSKHPDSQTKKDGEPRRRQPAIPRNRKRETPKQVPEPLSAVSANDDDDDAPVRPRKRPSSAAAPPDKKPKDPHTEDDSKADERPRKRPTNAAALPDVPRLKAGPSTDDADERPRKRPTNAAALPPIPRLKSPPKPTSEATPPNDSEDGGVAENQPRKRPTNAAVIPNNQRREARRLQEDREREQQQRAGGDGTGRPAAGVSDFVKQHYNAVPERGRQWRKTDSKIRGLRSFNNWVKSALMHKCVPRDDGPQPGDGRDENDGGGPRRGRRIKVLDIGCGKGGDLMKWQTHRVETYVGLDPADVSIHQARERYRGMARKSKFIFRADFVVRDCFGQSLEDVGAVRAVGWDRNIRDRWGGGGFDVVSMMFCMHYAFESEEKARTMLLNVAAALRRGGKLIGVIPNSDVLSDRVNDFHRRKSGAPVADDDDDDWDPEKSLDAPAEPRPDAVVRDDDEDGSPLSWGNSIYQVKFPGKLPADGVFRPPFGWKYFYFLEEAVEQVPEFVVPWEAFRGLAEQFNLELEYRRPFREVWRDLKDDPVLGPLSCRMGVRDQHSGALLVTDEEMEAASFYHAFSFIKV